jgi:hypothetical protein
MKAANQSTRKATDPLPALFVEWNKAVGHCHRAWLRTQAIRGRLEARGFTPWVRIKRGETSLSSPDAIRKYWNRARHVCNSPESHRAMDINIAYDIRALAKARRDLKRAERKAGYPAAERKSSAAWAVRGVIERRILKTKPRTVVGAMAKVRCLLTIMEHSKLFAFHDGNDFKEWRALMGTIAAAERLARV